MLVEGDLDALGRFGEHLGAILDCLEQISMVVEGGLDALGRFWGHLGTVLDCLGQISVLVDGALDALERFWGGLDALGWFGGHWPKVNVSQHPKRTLKRNLNSC